MQTCNKFSERQWAGGVKCWMPLNPTRAAYAMCFVLSMFSRSAQRGENARVDNT